MTKEVVEETNDYQNGQRINVSTIKSAFSISDDLQQLAQYQANLGNRYNQLQTLKNTKILDDNQSQTIQNEIERVKNEITTLKKAIDIQQNFVNGYDVYGI